MRYKIRNGVCTILIKLSNITFNNNGAYNLEEVLPQSASPAYEVLSPVVTYGLSGTFNYNETQTWISIIPSGKIRFVGGIVNKTVSNCLVCVSYTI